MKFTRKETKAISIALASWGILLIGSGGILTTMQEPAKVTKTKLEVIQKRVAEAKTNEIKLKDMTLEINQPLSVDVKDYLENIEELDDSVIKALKLDTSMVNINQAGTYTYTISFKKKKYNGTFVIKEKELPQVDLTLKNLSLEVGSALSTNLSTYINEPIADEVKNNITLNLTAVNTMQPGNYQYTVTYDGRLYTGTIEIYEPQPTILTPNSTDKTEEKEETGQTEQTEENATTSPQTGNTTQ